MMRISAKQLSFGFLLAVALVGMLLSATVTANAQSGQNAAPVVNADCGVGPFEVGDTVELVGSAFDRDGQIQRSFWRFPDGRDRAGDRHKFTFEEPGEYAFAFIAVDDDGAQNGDLCRITVSSSSSPSTPTPVPKPVTPTAVPSTPQPTPAPSTPTPAPQPTSGPSTPTPAPEPTATSSSSNAGTPSTTPNSDEPTSVPTVVPTVEPTSPDEGIPIDDASTDLGSDPRSSSGVIPGLLIATWPQELIVDEPGTVTVELRSTDWRPDAEEYGETGFIVTITANNISHEYAIYGKPGPVPLTIEFEDNNRLQLVGSAGGEPAQKRQVATFERFRTDSVQWRVVAIEPGVTTIRILADNAVTANTQDPAPDEVLEAMNVDDIGLLLELRVVATERTDWLPIALWEWLPLLLLPFVPVGTLLGLRRDPEPVVGPTAHHPERGQPASALAQDSALILSGGGLRATAFSAGAALYLAEHGHVPRLAQIASVSGGSLTNAYIAGETHRSGTPASTGGELRALIRSIAHHGLPLERSAKAFAAALAVGVGWLGFILFRAAPGPLLGFATWFAASAVFGVLSWIIYTQIAIGPALKRWVPSFIGLDRATPLAALATTTASITHVFTSTTTSSEHVHLSPTQSLLDPPGSEEATGDQPVYGQPTTVKLADAVQASAAFPGLPRVTVDAQSVGFPSRSGKLTLRDGGSLDNLGHIGATLAEEDATEAYRGWLSRFGAIDRWIVVDSSAKRSETEERQWRRPNRLLELLHLGFAADMAEMAASSAAATTDQTAAFIQRHFDENQNGLYLSLDQSPFELCEAVLRANPQYETEAVDAAIQQIRMGDTPNWAPTASSEQAALSSLLVLRAAASADPLPEWRTRSATNSTVPTTLSSLGQDQTADLLQHGYALAATQAAICFGWPTPSADQLQRQRFYDLSAP